MGGDRLSFSWGIHFLPLPEKNAKGSQGSQWMYSNHRIDVEPTYLKDVSSSRLRWAEKHLPIEHFSISSTPSSTGLESQVYAAGNGRTPVRTLLGAYSVRIR
mmetsp:Transcript_12382/g.34103  ORF Transcript_12382/g.34103 Transcript_12382/m.34103 type:complete len:102 (+) Transcript_12382:112-417(+)